MQLSIAAQGHLFAQSVVRQIAGGTGETPRPDHAWVHRPAGERVLPPFLGEMGFEVRYFLGVVEPWLKSGWRILAKRPELYPAGSAIADPQLFHAIGRLRRAHRTTEIGSRIAIPRPDLVAAIEIGEEAPGGDGQRRVRAACSIANIDAYAPSLVFEAQLKRLVFERIAAPDRPQTFWDHYLTSVHDPVSDPFMTAAAAAVPPSALPQAFCEPRPDLPHVGCQLRLIPEKPINNSDAYVVLDHVQVAAELLGLPVIFYGPDAGTFAPAGARRTAHMTAPGQSLLDAELRLLPACRIMFAPDSGWADMMGWLRVPTFIESQHFAYGFEGLRSFRPRLALLPGRAEDLESALASLLAADTSMPDPLACRQAASHFAPDIGYLREYAA